MKTAALRLTPASLASLLHLPGGVGITNVVWDADHQMVKVYMVGDGLNVEEWGEHFRPITYIDAGGR